MRESFHPQRSSPYSNRRWRDVPRESRVWPEFKFFSELQFIFAVFLHRKLPPVISIFRSWWFWISIPHWSSDWLFSTKDQMCKDSHLEVTCLLSNRLLPCFPSASLNMHHYIASTKTEKFQTCISISQLCLLAVTILLCVQIWITYTASP